MGINPSGLAHSAGSLEHWTKPHENSVKINCDASIFTNPDRVGLGWLVRDSTGEILAAGRRCMKGNPGSYWAEAISILEALSWVKGEDERRRLLRGNQQIKLANLQNAMASGVVFVFKQYS
ncbi:hypothetical protein ACET3Z_006791 [Daucus carota]